MVRRDDYADRELLKLVPENALEKKIVREPGLAQNRQEGGYSIY